MRELRFKRDPKGAASSYEVWLNGRKVGYVRRLGRRWVPCTLAGALGAQGFGTRWEAARELRRWLRAIAVVVIR